MQERPYILRDLFFNRVAQTSSAPLGVNIKRAEGVFLYAVDDDGAEKPIIDLISGVSVSNVGHCNREVVDAIKDQAERYTHIMVYGEMIEAPQVLHARLLASVLPEKLGNIYYVNSGSEANEGALKLAKRVTGRKEMISFKHAYHGSSHGALSMMSDAAFKSAFQPLLPDVKYLDFNSTADLHEISERTACVLIEPVQGEGGVQVATKEFMTALRKRCSEVGALLIFDEIQTGFGRTGKMFAFEHYNVVPDILTMAKALGGGMPLGAFAASKELMSAWQSNPPLGHITTFGGHPVSCAAALASLKILLREKWIEEVKEKNRMYVEALSAHPKVKEIRSLGLLIAVDLKDERAAHDILYHLLDEGVLTDWFLFQPTSFRIAPPLCITFEEVRLSIDLIIKALGKL